TDLRWVGVAAAGPASGAALSDATGSTFAMPRGQLKSSARPLGAGSGPPVVGAPVTAAGVAPPPSRSSGAMRVSVSDTIGPAAGRCVGPSALAFGACGLAPTGAGSATGTLLLPTM